MLSTQGMEPDLNLVTDFAKMGLLCDRTGRAKDIKALYNLGVSSQQQGKIEAAIHSYQQVIGCWAKISKKALLPYVVNAYSNWGCILVQEGKFDEAIEVFQAGIAVAPGDATLYNNLGIALLEQRKPEEAIAFYRKAIELQPELVMARHNLGKAFQRLGLHAFAGECFEQVISKQPDHVAAYSDRAFSLMAQGKLAEAMVCFRGAISLQSEFVDDFCDRASLLIERDELDRAKVTCARFIKALTANQLSLPTISEHLVQTYVHLGNVLAEYGGYEQAESYYQKALQIQPHNVDIYLRLGNCLAKQQRFSAAIVVYRMALVIAGDRSDISEQLQVVLEKQQKLIDSQENEGFGRGSAPVPTPPTDEKSVISEIRAGTGAPPLRENKKALLVNGNNQQKSECQGLDCHRCLNRIFRQFEPIHLGNGVFSCSPQTETAIDSPETFVAKLPNGRAWVVPQKNSWMICNAIAIIDQDNQLLPEFSREYPGELPGCENKHSTQHRFLNLEPEELPPLEQIDGTVAVLAGLSGNVYFHWMVDILPRVEILLSSGVNLEEINWFLVNSCQQPFQRETLKALGIPESKIIECDRHPYIQAKQLIVPSFSGYLGWLSPRGLKFLRQVFLHDFAHKHNLHNYTKNTFLSGIQNLSNNATNSIKTDFPPSDRKSYPERIYITRSKCSYRRVINEENVIEILSGFGFVSVLLESMDLDEQIALFASAKVIVAPHGSGLTNMMFCEPGTKVIELMSPNYIRHYYWAISQQLNLEHYYITGESFNCYQIRELMYQNPLTEDILVNLKSLKKIMGEINLLASNKALNLILLENPKNHTQIMNQESADYFQKRAEFYLEQGKLGDAVTACEQALKQKPDFAPAYKTLGKASQVQGNLAKAKHWYTKALEIQPNFAEVYTNLATLYAQEKDWERALVCYQKSTELQAKNTKSTNNERTVLSCDIDDIEVYIQGAEAFYAQRKFEQAAAACQRVIKVKPDARAYKICGNARQAQGKVEEAKNCYAKAIEIDPDFAEAYTNLGTLYAQEQQWQPAIACYQKAIALQPNLASTYRNLARVWTQMGQLSEADDCWFKAYSLEPAKATPEEHIHLGDNFLKQNQVTQAIRCYCHAIELNPSFNDAYQHLGIAIKVQKKLNEETATYRQIIERPANIFGDLFKTVILGLNGRSELPQQPKSTLSPNSTTNPLEVGSTISTEKPHVQLSSEPIDIVASQLNAIALSTNSTPISQNSTDVLSPVTVIQSNLEPDSRKQEVADTCIQQAESYYHQKQFDQALFECKRAIEMKPDAVDAYKLCGKILQAQENTEGAIDCYKKALKIKFNDAEIQVNLGSLYAMRKQWSLAITCYQQAIAIQPTLTPAYRNLARVWTQAGKLEEANECWYEAYSLEPEKVPSQQHLKLGNSLFKQGQMTHAIICYRRAIELNPNFAGAYQNMGKALKQQGKLDEAALCFQRVAELNKNSLLNQHKSGSSIAAAQVNSTSNGHAKSAEIVTLSAPTSGNTNDRKISQIVPVQDAETHIKQAESYYSERQYEEAVAECKRAIEIKPEVALAYKILGNATQAMGKVDAAWYWYAQALEIDPDFAEVHANLGSLYAQQKQWKKSIACYRKAIEINPNLASAYRNLAKVFVLSGQPKLGADCWYQALTLDINWATAEEHFTLGNTLLEQGKLDRAISCYQRAIQLQPSYADAYHNLGEVLSVQGKWEEAIATYRQAIEFNPNFEGSHYSLGKALASVDRREEAIACYRSAIELNPNLAQAYQSLGEVLDSWGRLDEAIGCYEKTIELKPDIWEVHHKLGDALQEKGDIDEAIEAYNRAIEIAKV